MKKTILILAGLAIAGFAFKDKIFGTSADAQTLPGSSTDNSFFSMYEGKLVIDPAGYWMVIKDGRIHTFSSEQAWARYAKENPQHSTPIVVDFPAWMDYAVNQVGGVATLPGY